MLADITGGEPMRKNCRCNGVSVAALLAVYALGLVSSYILPAAAIIVILAIGLLVLGICRIKF